MWRRLRKLGPGLITGASKNDPASLATYAKIGAQGGLRLLWPLLFTYPLLAVIQEISARTGRATGCGLAGNARRHLAAGVLKWLTLALLAYVLGAFAIQVDWLTTLRATV